MKQSELVSPGPTLPSFPRRATHGGRVVFLWLGRLSLIYYCRRIYGFLRSRSRKGMTGLSQVAQSYLESIDMKELVFRARFLQSLLIFAVLMHVACRLSYIIRRFHGSPQPKSLTLCFGNCMMATNLLHRSVQRFNPRSIFGSWAQNRLDTINWYDSIHVPYPGIFINSQILPVIHCMHCKHWSLLNFIS